MDKLCPDHQLLSVYCDGELPSPWKEKMESHISGCSSCARRLEEYRRISGAFEQGNEPVLETARERVWAKLEQSAGLESVQAPAAPMPRHMPRRHDIWRRSITIPIPAAAAALVLMVALAFLMLVRVGQAGQNPGMAAGMTFASETEIDIPGFIPLSDMENMLQYLGSHDNDDMIILRLPESRNFVNYSEPAIIKAADYSRIAPEWSKP